MTTRKRRVQVFLGALGCASLALVLVAEATAAPASAQSGRKRRAGLAASDEEFGIRPAAWLTLRPVWMPPGTDQKPPAAPLVAETLAIEIRAVTATPRRGGHGSTGIPKVVPPFPGPPPASPIR